MDKKLDESPEPPPMAAPTEVWLLLRARAEEIGLTWDEALKKAGIENRATAHRIKKGTASMSVARRIEDALEEAAPRRGASGGSLMDATSEWTAIGFELAALDPRQFRRTLASMREILVGARAMRALRHPLPEADEE